MSRKSYILGIDIGTSSLKAGLFNGDYQLLTVRQAEYSYHSFEMCVQIEPEEIWKAFLKAMDGLRDYLSQVETVVPCVFSTALIALDQENFFLNRLAIAPLILPTSSLTACLDGMIITI